MTKQILDEAIAKNDPSGIITSGGKTTQWSLEDASSSSSTPRSQSPTLTPTSSQFLDSYPPSGTSTPGFVPPGIPNLSTTLTLRPRSGAKLQTCPLCPSVKLRTYAPKALHDHLSSAVHQCSNALIAASYLPAPAITFHCPRGLAGAGDATKIKEFASVAGWRSISRAVPARGAKKR
ncbi:hypothetical protein PMIN03_001682 [Paraphaeosphaeria minitans]|uniref:Uncharacterized protein n=1 Tax=Paraphaeosphaeria minitans TaxID=565426 RepID=A0A9P6GQ59_9PLEO|nr:hypothetical protein PMIN01_03467 [Paraphaeosphaeria minitans]